MNLNSLEINHDHFPSMSLPNFQLSGGSVGYWTACNKFKRYYTLPTVILPRFLWDWDWDWDCANNRSRAMPWRITSCNSWGWTLTCWMHWKSVCVPLYWKKKYRMQNTRYLLFGSYMTSEDYYKQNVPASFVYIFVIWCIGKLPIPCHMSSFSIGIVGLTERIHFCLFEDASRHVLASLNLVIIGSGNGVSPAWLT